MKRFLDLPPALKAYITAVVVCGLVVSGLVLAYHWPPPDEAIARPYRPYLLPLLIAWVVLCGMARLDLAILGGTMTLGTGAISLAQILLGSPAAVLVAAVGAAIADYTSHIKSGATARYRPPPMYRWLFNVANCLVAAGVAGFTYLWVYRNCEALQDRRIVPAILAWVTVYFTLNSWGVAVAVALRTRQPLLRVWRENFLWTAPGYLASTSLSVALYFAIQKLDIWSVLFLPPIYLVYRSWRLHLDKLAAARQYEELVENARDGVLIVNRELSILYANQAFTEMLGYERGALVGRRYPEILVDGEGAPAPPQSTREQTFTAQTLRKADGKPVPVEISTSPAVYEGHEGCVQALVRDVSERLAATQTEKLRALGQMAAGVAHDFNNSLAVILGNVGLALTRLPAECDEDHSATAERLRAVEQAANDAAATVRRLQAFGRPTTGQPETVNLHELGQEVLLMTRPIWRDATRAAGREVSASVDGDPGVFVRGSPAELREALTNLLNNAVHAMPRGGTLRLTTRREENEAVLTIADTGIGMTTQVRERIFEPFYTTKGEKGSGLGLFVTYGLVTQHGGRLEVTSASDVGTTFILRFPAVTPQASERAESPVTLRTGARVLVVDDEAEVRDVIVSILRGAGIETREAAGGSAALEAVAAERVDLVVTDLSMPEMSGLDLARELRARRPLLPILLLTGWIDVGAETSVNSELVSGVLTKPVTTMALLKQVDGLLPPPDGFAAVTNGT